MSVDAVMRQLAKQRRANKELQRQNVALPHRLAARRDLSLINLDEVDDDAIEESMAQLVALSQELWRSFKVKEEFADLLLLVLGSIPGAILPESGGANDTNWR